MKGFIGDAIVAVGLFVVFITLLSTCGLIEPKACPIVELRQVAENTLDEWFLEMEELGKELS